MLEGDFGRVAVEIKLSSRINVREVRGLRDFVSENKARLGLVITNDAVPRRSMNLMFIPTSASE